MQIEDIPQKNPQEHLKRLKKGSLLFSVDSMLDPNFTSSVVLICHHSEEGAYGLVLNRASHMPLTEIFNSLDHHQKWVKKVFIGGPVQPEELQILQITGAPVVDSIEISENVYLGGHWDDFDQIIQGEPKHLRLFLGYSGWGAHQLEGEILAGGWEVYPCNLQNVLDQDEDPWNTQGLENFKKSLIDRL